MSSEREFPTIAFESRDAWGSWLADHHQASPGLWLKIAKTASGVDSVSYADAVEIALCYGWIDGQKAAFDDSYWLQRFTPRKPRSRWSKLNREAALRLIAAREMKPAGMAEVERAQADGRWEAAYAGQGAATVPDDLERALAANEPAREFFTTLNSVNRYAIIYRIHDAKRPETRARRIEKYVAMLARHEKLHP
jgi:uncharacterized protein YdeI (YjbR/CyaY-like superfamily)